MIIQSSNVNLASRHDYRQTTKESRKVTEWQNANPKNRRSYSYDFSANYEESSFFNNYNEFARDLKQSKEKTWLPTAKDSLEVFDGKKLVENQEIYPESTRKIFRSLLDLLLSRRGTFLRGWQGVNSREFSFEGKGGEMNALSNSTMWTRVTESNYTMQEFEATEFSGMGTAVTADGRELQFAVNFAMTREFCVEFHMEQMEEYERVLTDPLVINLDSNPTELAEQTFLFDIDCDGKKEEVSMLAGKSGFIALDKNDDGVINDGSELFGTRSGNGFADLAEYDTDGNGWIDEADDIYRKLKIWVKTEDGSDKLLSLKESDVGAIYLGNTSTNYSIRGAEGLLNGVIRRSGMFLREDGKVGTVQQIDLANRAV